jgi:23S rRNA (guanosine2251-2'-O)-methyltransferase
VYGAAADADLPYQRPDYRGRVVLVLGSEGRGLRPRVAAGCDEMVRLPRHGRVGSLNLSTAAAALVYGILHFRQALDRAP